MPTVPPDPPPDDFDPRPAPSGYVTTFVYDSTRPLLGGPSTTYTYDPDGMAHPRSTWYTTYDRNGPVVDTGPTPLPEPPPAADEPPDEPHIIG